MPYFKKNLNKIAKDTDKCLKYFFSKLSSDAHLANPMKYSLFSGGKKFQFYTKDHRAVVFKKTSSPSNYG